MEKKKVDFCISNKKYEFEIHPSGVPFFYFHYNGNKFFVSPPPVTNRYERANSLFFRNEKNEYVKEVTVDWLHQYLVQIGLTHIEYAIKGGFTVINAVYINNEKIEDFELINFARDAYEKVTNGVSKLRSSKIGEALKIRIEDIEDYINIKKDENFIVRWHSGWDDESKEWGRDLNAAY